MDINAMLTELQAQRQQLDDAIAVFERLASGRGEKRRGRPPAWMKEADQAAKPVRTKKKVESNA